MATSISLLKPGLKTAIVEGLYNEIQTNTNNYYYFLGRTLEWSGAEDQATAPQESLEYEALTRERMIFMKKITSSDVSFTITRYDWQSGTVFDKYDTGVGRTTTVNGCDGNVNTNYIIYPVDLDISTIAIGDLVSGANIAVGATVSSIDTTNHRVYITSNNTGVFSGASITFTTISTSGATSPENAKFYCITVDNNVYKCIDNNGGAESTVMPYGISYKNITTSDGYVWKYMYTVPVALANKFSTLTDIPVTTAIKNQFYSKGTIASTTIVNPGSGYAPGSYITVTGDGYLRDNVYRISSLNVDDAGYGYQTTPTLTISDPFITVPFVGAVDYNFVVASSNGDLNVTTDEITITNHGLTTGDALTYNSNGTNIGGLTNAKTYYVIVVNSNTIKLAGTYQNALDDVSINLSVGNSAIYGTHTLVKQTDTYLIGQYVKAEDRIYEVTASGTFSSSIPTHTSTESVYNGTAALKFVGLSIQASLNIVDTSVDSVDLTGIIGYITIQEPGSGYNSNNPPVITITGDGSGAAAYPVIVDGRVVGAIVSNKGSGYSESTTQVVIDKPVSTALATAAVVGNEVTDIAVTYSGSGYNASTPPSVTISGGGGSNAAATAAVANGRVISITITNSGSGYTSAPTITIDAPPDTATATSTISGGEVTAITVTSSGDGYDEATPPSVTITGDGSGATAVATIVNGEITEVSVINAGTGYTTAPTVTIDPPGVQATAIADIYFGYGYSTTPLITVADPIVADEMWSSTGTIDNGDIIEYNNTFYEAVGYATSAITFDPSTAVNLTNNTILYTSHGLVTGNAVVYNNGGGTSIGGLVSGTTYYVVKINNDTIKVATTYANATAATPVVIDLTSGSSGSSHKLQSKNLNELPPITNTTPITFNPSTAVNLTNDTITYTLHGFTTGDAVVYRNGGGTSIGGIVDTTVYYVIVDDGNTFKLAATYDNAIAGTPVINLTSGSSGTSHTLQRVEVNGDFYLSYIARTAVITSTTIKTQAKLVPIIQNGQVVGVNIADGGIGYTTAKVNVYGPTGAKGAEIIADLSVGDLNTNQANVELLATPGTLDTIVITYPGSNYTWAQVDITGDGSGAAATATIVNGSINSITVTNAGSGYSKATISIVGDGSDQAYARAIVSPFNGHGSNAVRELFAKDITLSTSIAKDRNQGFGVDNDYRQLGIIKNPTEYNSTRRLSNFAGSTCYVITGDFNYNEISNDTILLDTKSYTVKEVVINNGGYGYVSPTIEFSDPAVVGGVPAIGTVQTDEDGVIIGITITNPGSGYTSAPSITINDPSGSGVEATATIYTQNRFLVVAKPEENPNTEVLSLLVQPIDNAVVEAGQTLYVETIGPEYERTITLVTPPTVNKYSGDMMYIDNRNAFVPSDEQTISIKTAIRF